MDFGEKYVDAVPVGHGAAGTVYRARSVAFSRDVAVKVFHGTLDDERLQRAFRRECEVLGALGDHPNIVAVHDSGITAARQPYLVMAYFDLGSLRVGTPMPPGEAAAVAVAVAEALQLAHERGVLHRDVKPQNVLRSTSGSVALADFGISVRSSEEVTSAASTPAYAAPEVLLDHTAASPASDVFSLAATVYALLAGQPPLPRRPGETDLVHLQRLATEAAPPLPESVPRALAAAVRNALEPDPVLRTRTARSFAEAVRTAAAADGLTLALPSVATGTLPLQPLTDPVPDDDPTGGGRVTGAAGTARALASPVGSPLASPLASPAASPVGSPAATPATGVPVLRPPAAPSSAPPVVPAPPSAPFRQPAPDLPVYADVTRTTPPLERPPAEEPSGRSRRGLVVAATAAVAVVAVLAVVLTLLLTRGGGGRVVVASPTADGPATSTVPLVSSSSVPVVTPTSSAAPPTTSSSPATPSVTRTTAQNVKVTVPQPTLSRAGRTATVSVTVTVDRPATFTVLRLVVTKGDGTSMGSIESKDGATVASSVTLSGSKTITQPGRYYALVRYSLGGKWIDGPSNGFTIRTFDANGIWLGAPTFAVHADGSVLLGGRVEVLQRTHFVELQIAVRAPGDVAVDKNGAPLDVAFHHDNTDVSAGKQISGSRTYAKGTYTANMAYKLADGKWVNGPTVTFTVP